MKTKLSRTRSLLLSAALLTSPLALAQTPDEGETISIEFRGPLGQALQQIAQDGGLSVVVTGNLDTPAEVYLNGVGARQALRTVARAYSLHVEEDGNIYTLRPMTAEEKVRSFRAGPSRPPVPPAPAIAPPPPLPAVPAVPRDVADAVAESALDEDEVKERVRERVKKVRRSSRGSRDVVARGRSLEVGENEQVESAVVYGGNLTVKGTVEDDAVVFGGNLEVTGRVEGDAHAFGGNVVLGPDAVVDGDVSAFGGSVIKQDGARVEGSTESFGGAGIGKLVAGELKENLKREARNAEHAERRERDGNGFAHFLVWFAMLFGLGFVGQLFFPARMKELGMELRAQPVKNGLVGVLGLMALVPITVVLAVTIIGIPVLLALMVAVPLTTGLAFSALASELGTRMPVLRGKKTQAMVLALGLLVLLVVGHIPVLGPVVLTLAMLASFGAVIRTRFGHRPRGMPEPIIPEQSPV